MIQVEFDPNVRVHGNGTYTALADLPDDVQAGDRVLLVEPESGVQRPGVVTEIDRDRGLVYFSVGWEAS